MQIKIFFMPTSLTKSAALLQLCGLFLFFYVTPFAISDQRRIGAFVEYKPNLFVEERALGFVDDSSRDNAYSEEAIWKSGTCEAFGWPLEVLSSTNTESNVGTFELARLRALASVLLADYISATDELCKFLYGGDPESVIQNDRWQIETALEKLTSAFHCRIESSKHDLDGSNGVVSVSFVCTEASHPSCLSLSLSKVWIGKNRYLYFPANAVVLGDFKVESSKSSPQFVPLSTGACALESVVSESSIHVLDREFFSFLVAPYDLITTGIGDLVRLRHHDFAVDYCRNPPLNSRGDIGFSRIWLADHLSKYRHSMESFCRLVYGTNAELVKQDNGAQLATLEMFYLTNDWYSGEETISEFCLDDLNSDSATLSVYNLNYAANPHEKGDLLTKIEFSRQWLSPSHFIWTVKQHDEIRFYVH